MTGSKPARRWNQPINRYAGIAIEAIVSIKNKLERADALARSVFDPWPLNLSELTKIWSLRAELALIQNDLLAADSALRNVCDNARMPRTHFSEGIWRIPREAGTCRVDIAGEADTTFRIHQLAN